MKISTRGRYALRLMLDVALESGRGPVPLADVARRQEISEKYLEQLSPPLVRAGLLKSVRGAAGGYLLTRPPGEYTVGEILRAQEGDLSPVACAGEGETCPRAAVCATAGLWKRIRAAVDGVVDTVTLQDLMDDHRALCAQGEETP